MRSPAKGFSKLALYFVIYVQLFRVNSFELTEPIKADKPPKWVEDLNPQHAISSTMRHKLINFRVQLNNNAESSKPKELVENTVKLKAQLKNLDTTTIDSLNMRMMPAFPPTQPTTSAILQIPQNLSSTTIITTESSLCLPEMPPPDLSDQFPLQPSAPPHELSHPPPIWLALLPHNRHDHQDEEQHNAKHRMSGVWLRRVVYKQRSPIDQMELRKIRSIPDAARMPKVNLRGDFYSSRLDRSLPASFGSRKNSANQKLQIAHPPSPNEKNWVMVAGNETGVDGVLSISLTFGGRLASMGFYRNSLGDLHYYAIMHRFSGSVFLKPDPVTYSELMKMAKENQALDLGLTQLCGHDNGEGKVLFSTYWERIPDVNFHIWFPGTAESEKQKLIYEKDGYRLVNICGYSIKNEARYVGVWQKPVMRVGAYEAHFGISLSECLALNEKLKAKEFVATQFRVFNDGPDILCAAIWEHVPGRQHFIEISDNLRQMYQKHASTPSRLPRQVSHFFDNKTKRAKYVVLWSDLHSFRYPDPPDIWLNKAIPVSYLSGSREQLNPAQLEFISKRVERFMRELDIPGLSVAISRNEQLKFSAGYGYANVRRREAVNPNHQFRIGSVSKPITATAIMILVERGKLQLNQRVFGGSDSIFGDRFSKNGKYRKYVTEITVRNLLEHTSGGWSNVDSDPAWLAPSRSSAQLIEQIVHEQPLLSKPGRIWVYSNFGYQLLGHIIEHTAGISYEQFVLKNIWQLVGVQDIKIARSTLSEKSRREVLYYMSGNKVGFNPYEMLPPERTGPWGGWIASPIELLQLMMASSVKTIFLRKNRCANGQSQLVLQT